MCHSHTFTPSFPIQEPLCHQDQRLCSPTTQNLERTRGEKKKSVFQVAPNHAVGRAWGWLVSPRCIHHFLGILGRAGSLFAGLLGPVGLRNWCWYLQQRRG